MKLFIASVLLLAGCDASGSSNAPPFKGVELPTTPETFGLSWELIERMEEHFGGRVSIVQDGEYEDGEHYLVKHSGEIFIVVYDLEQDQIVSISKAGTKGEQP